MNRFISKLSALKLVRSVFVGFFAVFIKIHVLLVVTFLLAPRQLTRPSAVRLTCSTVAAFQYVTSMTSECAGVTVEMTTVFPWAIEY